MIGEQKKMRCRGIRGATTVVANTRENILAATRELLLQIISTNGINEEDVACILFTTTEDLDAEFPAVAARELGLNRSALMCGHEMNVPGSLPRCLRVLLLVNTDKNIDDIVHVYIGAAKSLRSTDGNG